MILDLGLPDIDGADALRMMRSVSDVPVIVATARRSEGDIIRLLNDGADDYVTKPFSGGHILARISAVLRRNRAAGDDGPAAISIGPLVINQRQRQATLDGTQLKLTRREFDVLTYLAERAGRVVSRRELMTEVWQQARVGEEQTIDVHISWLRRKLGETAAKPRFLHTVRGVGVMMVVPTMRWALNRLAVAITSMVALAFLVPLAGVTRQLAHDRALGDARQQATAIVAALAVDSSPALLARAVASTTAGNDGRLAVHLPDGVPIGVAHAPRRRTSPRPPETAARSPLSTSAGLTYLQPSVIDGGRAAVIEVFVPAGDVYRGVWVAWWRWPGSPSCWSPGPRCSPTGWAAGSCARPAIWPASRDGWARVTSRAGEPDRPAGTARRREQLQRDGRQPARAHRRRTRTRRRPVAPAAHPADRAAPGRRGDAGRTGRRPHAPGVRPARRGARGDHHRCPPRRGRRTAASTDLVEVLADRLAFWSALAEDQGRARRSSAASAGAGAAAARRTDPRHRRDAGQRVRAHAGGHRVPGAGVAGTGSSVDDAGPGIADPAAAVRRGVSGAGSTGLGLDIVHRVAERGRWPDRDRPKPTRWCPGRVQSCKRRPHAS